MSAKEEICHHDQRITDLTKRRADLRLRLASVEDQLKKASGRLGSMQAKVSHHRGNRRHMKRVAVDVNIEEFATTLAHIATHREELEDAQRLMAQLVSGQAQTVRELEVVEKDLEAHKVQRAKYCLVIEVPAWRAAA